MARLLVGVTWLCAMSGVAAHGEARGALEMGNAAGLGLAAEADTVAESTAWLTEALGDTEMLATEHGLESINFCGGKKKTEKDGFDDCNVCCKIVKKLTDGAGLYISSSMCKDMYHSAPKDKKLKVFTKCNEVMDAVSMDVNNPNRGTIANTALGMRGFLANAGLKNCVLAPKVMIVEGHSCPYHVMCNALKNWEKKAFCAAPPKAADYNEYV